MSVDYYMGLIYHYLITIPYHYIKKQDVFYIAYFIKILFFAESPLDKSRLRKKFYRDTLMKTVLKTVSFMLMTELPEQLSTDLICKD